jgi:hypothetical protein
VTARLERHVCCRAFRRFGAILESSRLRVGTAKWLGVTLADDPRVLYEDAADGWVGLDRSAAVHGKTDGAAKKVLVNFIGSGMHDQVRAGSAAGSDFAGSVRLGASGAKKL